MAKDPKYIKNAEDLMKKYQAKLGKIEAALKDYDSRGKEHLMSQSNEISEKYNEAQEILMQLKSSTAENFEEIKGASVEMFSDLKDAIGQFSHFLTMDHIMNAKDEIVHYGAERAHDLEDKIKSNPFTTAAIALGVGFVVGAILSRSK